MAKKPNKKVLQDKLKALEIQEAELMSKMVAYKESNLIEFFDRPNPLQTKLLKAWDDPTYKVFTFTGGNRIGKTTIGVILAICTCAGQYLFGEKKSL